MLVQKRKDIPNHSKELDLLERLAQRLFRNLIRCRVPGAAALPRAELSIVLTSDKKIRSINQKWRNKDKATDVLSFPAQSKQELNALGKLARTNKLKSQWPLGDIVIALETAERQAKEKKLSLNKELEILLTHGFLHLLGFDHEVGEREARRMRRLERKLLTH